ncbi:MAG TPA: DUF1579 family protein [Tepidisphaeraceae bacterium]|jgi:hypothetical protein|nr:DUF1579 family protein [Tepidisphaeraceae bacterium]
MNFRKLSAPALLCGIGLAIFAGTLAVAEPSKEKAAAKPQIKLPPGWTEADMQACMMAGVPGKNHEYLARGTGVWQGKQTLWMFGSDEPMTAECTSKITSIMDGRYTRVEVSGEMPGMGPYSGFGIYGFDNVTGKFVSTWIDNHNTGIMNGIGELSDDGKVLTWKFAYQCPVTKKPAIMREVETITGDNTKTLEIFASDPKSGKESRTMKIEFTKK